MADLILWIAFGILCLIALAALYWLIENGKKGKLLNNEKGGK